MITVLVDVQLAQPQKTISVQDNVELILSSITLDAIVNALLYIKQLMHVLIVVPLTMFLKVIYVSLLL